MIHNMEPTVRTIEFFVSESQHAALQLAAVEHDVTIGSLLRELISEWMDKEPTTDNGGKDEN